MSKRIPLLAVFVAVSTLSIAQHCRKVEVDKGSGFCTVPDSALTPGEMDSSLACVTNSDRPRAVTEAEKNQILAAYGWPANTKKSSGEFDHWFPHWMGGSDGPNNIWFEPHAGKFGSYAKDKVELMLWRKVCVDKSMTLGQAKAQYLHGWTKLIPKQGDHIEEVLIAAIPTANSSKPDAAHSFLSDDCELNFHPSKAQTHE